MNTRNDNRATAYKKDSKAIAFTFRPITYTAYIPVGYLRVYAAFDANYIILNAKL